MSNKKNKKKKLIRLMNKQTGVFYVRYSLIKNSNPVKLAFKKYDPKLRKHVLFNEDKIK